MKTWVSFLCGLALFLSGVLFGGGLAMIWFLCP